MSSHREPQFLYWAFAAILNLIDGGIKMAKALKEDLQKAKELGKKLAEAIMKR